MNPCTPNIQEAGLNKQEAEELAQRMMNLAKARGGNLDVALREIAGEIRSQDKLLEQINKRNALLNIRAKRSVKDFAHRFDTIGEGILTLIEGGSKVIRGARNSIDAQAKALHLQYFGRLVAELEKNDLLRRFKSGTDSRNFFIEMGELGNRMVNREKQEMPRLPQSRRLSMVLRPSKLPARTVPVRISKRSQDTLFVRLTIFTQFAHLAGWV